MAMCFELATQKWWFGCIFPNGVLQFMISLLNKKVLLCFWCHFVAKELH